MADFTRNFSAIRRMKVEWSASAVLVAFPRVRGSRFSLRSQRSLERRATSAIQALVLPWPETPLWLLINSMILPDTAPDV
jgi:hypothetical protein